MSNKSQPVPADVVALVCAARQILERGYVSTSIADEKPDADALDAALGAFSSRVCYDDEGGTLPEAHADPCTCGATIDNHPLTPKPVDDREAGDGYHQVLPVDREAANALVIECALPWEYYEIFGIAFARHREQAERGLREALEVIISRTSSHTDAWFIARKALDTRP